MTSDQNVPPLQLKTDVEKLLVASIAATLARVVKFYNGDNVGLRDEFRSVLLKELAEHRSPDVELLRKQKIDAEIALQDLVEEMKENQAEFVRALASANENVELAEQEAAYFSDLEEAALKNAEGWRSVVVECENILGMNGETPTDPKTSAVPMRIKSLVDAIESSKKRRDEVIRILQGVK